ncbi:MAG: hypothetical protein FD122_2242 [Stygiobacter sp.]|nr:MAG: hypothetical protein FD122_2242 [Stygiobacter sp.]KAF0216968.1 MAG: hypothetical protein FD178_881 [Ignavibacteria bacterium]
MDKLKAEELEKKVKGMVLEGYEIIKLLNNGKSAAVFRAKKNDRFTALKIFDNELVERFGHEIQTKRIEQEIALKNHSIENLIKIHEGGKTELKGETYYYIIMDLIEGINLKEFISGEEYDEKFIKNVLFKLYQVTEKLISNHNIVHRDIKPENIMIDEKRNITLMDLGVVKLIGAKSFSDYEEKQFVGTLRYAPPEFLLREENNTTEGWKAVNLYQIGAVLHDLIVKRELFYDKTPYPNLVIAIKDDNPSITNIKYSFDLLQLTRDLLTKDYKKRLLLCPEGRILEVIMQEKSNPDELNDGIEEIMKMRIGHQAKFDEIEKLQRNKDEIKKRQKEFAVKLNRYIDNVFDSIKQKKVFRDYSKSNSFLLDTDKSTTKELVENFIYELKGELKQGFPKNLYVFVRLIIDESNYTEIELLGIIPAIFNQNSVFSNPLAFFKEAQSSRKVIKPYNIFKGNVELDMSFASHVETRVIRLIRNLLIKAEPEVKEELEWREQVTKSTQRIVSKMTLGHSIIFIDKE